ncbi:GAP family protein [Streptomyces sp. RKAG293]|uniref:GAP family protein n=1 Tax=Streptomyces sp. RKAG293 TaxID=2893403 RepID=UPI0020332542|nr:GAP family protein [Streptomyces sp. RKAG293]MCM2420103.1 GAP family protein [Streptomyces sp. RKAG293]
MVLDLVLIGVAITLGPLHNTAFILLLSAPGGVRKGLAFILAWLACLVAVIAAVILLTGGNPPTRNSNPSTAALALKLALGLGMVVYGEGKRRRDPKPRPAPKWMARLDGVSLWFAAALGFLLQPWAMVAAGGATVVQAHLSSIGSYLALMGYVLLATSSLLAMELYATFRPETAHVRLAALRSWVDGHQDQAIVALSLVIGLWLVGKSIYGLVG